jgi:hypothetical protein
MVQMSPFLIETELLHIYPAELHLESDEYISLANKKMFRRMTGLVTLQRL